MRRNHASLLDPTDLIDRMALTMRRSRQPRTRAVPYKRISDPLLPTACEMARSLLAECEAAGIRVELRPDAGEVRCAAE